MSIRYCKGVRCGKVFETFGKHRMCFECRAKPRKYTVDPRRLHKDIPAAKIEARFQAELKKIKAERRYRIEGEILHDYRDRYGDK